MWQHFNIPSLWATVVPASWVSAVSCWAWWPTWTGSWSWWPFSPVSPWLLRRPRGESWTHQSYRSGFTADAKIHQCKASLSSKVDLYVIVTFQVEFNLFTDCRICICNLYEHRDGPESSGKWLLLHPKRDWQGLWRDTQSVYICRKFLALVSPILILIQFIGYL